MFCEYFSMCTLRGKFWGKLLSLNQELTFEDWNFKDYAMECKCNVLWFESFIYFSNWKPTAQVSLVFSLAK